MIARSRQEQLDLELILSAHAELANIHVRSRMRGVTESEVDALLGGATVKAGKLAGAILIVGVPEETADPASQGGNAILDRRSHLVRVIEQVKVNRKPGWEGDAAQLACGYTADELKDIVKQALHGQYLGSAMLLHRTSEEYEDVKGGSGWDVKFQIEGQIYQPQKSADPRIGMADAAARLSITCFSSAGDGTISLTVNGTAHEAVCGNDVTDVPLYGDGGAYDDTQVAANLAAFYAGVLTGLATVAASGANVNITTVALGEMATLSFSRGDLTDSFSTPENAAGPDDLITITGGGNPGEVLRYTTDGSTPVAGNAEALTYSAPFAAPASGTVIRAASTATSRTLSGITEFTVE